MKLKIDKDLVAATKPQAKPFEIYDTEMKGLTLRVQPSGVMTYIVRYRLNGKQGRVVIGKPEIISPTAARSKAKNILADVTHGIDPAAKKAVADYTFSTFLEKEYQPWVEMHRKDGKATVARIKACYPDFSDTVLSAIDPWTVEKWRTARLKANKLPATVNRDLVALKAMLSKAVEWGKLESHPLAKVKPSKVDSAGKVRFLDDAEELRLLQALDVREERMRAERDSCNAWRKVREYPPLQDLRAVTFVDYLKPMVIVSINTGLRWGELTGLIWSDIDLKRSILTVRGDVAKSSKTRHVPLNSVVLKLLKEWQKQSCGTLVFPGKEGKPRNNVKSAWKTLLDAAKITAFRWHDMRHHFASRLVMAGVDLNTVRELLGHSDLKMTLRYAHLGPEHKAAAVAMLVR